MFEVEEGDVDREDERGRELDRQARLALRESR